MLLNLIAHDSQRKYFAPLHVFVAPKTPFVFGVPIYFSLEFKPSRQTFVLSPFLVCQQAELGFSPGNIVTPESGISTEIAEDSLAVFPAAEGVTVVSKEGGTTQNINPNFWQLSLRGLIL